MGDVALSDMKATYYPPSIQPVYMGAFPPVKNGYGSLYDSSNVNYFQSYRNETLSKMQMPPYEWGLVNTPYSPKPDIAVLQRTSNKLLNLPRPGFSMLDPVRNEEVDNFYKSAQMHRDQYKDHTGRLHPLDYYNISDYKYQCAQNPTYTYTKFPEYYVKYKENPVLPTTLTRTIRGPPLPARALTGRYAPTSDIAFKR